MGDHTVCTALKLLDVELDDYLDCPFRQFGDIRVAEIIAKNVTSQRGFAELLDKECYPDEVGKRLEVKDGHLVAFEETPIPTNGLTDDNVRKLGLFDYADAAADLGWDGYGFCSGSFSHLFRGDDLNNFCALGSKQCGKRGGKSGCGTMISLACQSHDWCLTKTPTKYCAGSSNKYTNQCDDDLENEAFKIGYGKKKGKGRFWGRSYKYYTHEQYIARVVYVAMLTNPN